MKYIHEHEADESEADESEADAGEADGKEHSLRYAHHKPKGHYR